MNNSSLNGSGLNGSGSNGNNASLSGGISTTKNLSASFIISAVLAGGLFVDLEAKGAISQKLQGGIEATQSVGGKHKIENKNQGGIYVTTLIDSLELGLEPSLKSGIFSFNSVGGNLSASAVLTTTQLGVGSTVDSPVMGRGTVLVDGIRTSSYVTGNIVGSTVLFGDGVKSTTQLGGDVKSGRLLSGGNSSNWEVGGKYHYPAYLSGGIYKLTEVGKEIDISPLLQDGIQSVNSLGGLLRLHSVGNGGVERSFTFDSVLRISPNLSQGVSSNHSLVGSIKIDAKLQGGINTENYIDGSGIIATQRLTGGITFGPSKVDGGQILGDAVLTSGLSSSSQVGGDVYQSFVDPLLNTWALEVRSATVLLEILHPNEDI